jgi:hypothetical protein
MLEALWSVKFGTNQQFYGAGVIVFETNRIFGGDTCFYYIGHFTYNVRDQTVSGEVEVKRHAPGLPFIFPPYNEGTVILQGTVSTPTMMLTGHLAGDPSQAIAVHCTKLAALP